MTTEKLSGVIEDFHGTKVADPYRWLEDTSLVETKQWEEEMAAESAAYFTETESSKKDRERLTELWNFPKYFVPKKVNNKLFYLKNDGLQNQAILYVKQNNEEHIVIDPNTLTDDGTVAMTNYVFNSDGTLVAYATSRNGSDWQEIKVRNTETGEDLVDFIQHVKFTNIAWSPDDSGFFYSRFPEPGTDAEEGTHNKVYFHKLGTNQAEDTLVHEQPEDKDLMFSASLSQDKKYIMLHVYFGTASENRFYLKELDSDGPFVRLLDEQNAEYTYITNDGTQFYFHTDLDAPKGRIISIDVENPAKENWVEVLPEQELVVERIKFLNDQFIVVFLKHAYHVIHLFNRDGSFDKEIELPVIGSLTDITVNKDEGEIYFGFTSFLHPTVVYNYHVVNGELRLDAQSDIAFDVEGYETTQVFYPSKDGTKIPMFLTHKKGLELDGENPVMLYGYGGFNVSITPSFNPAILRWLEKGGVYAVANLRGGNEYGEEWHRAGMLENKQNVFDDFITAGEWLIANKYTSTPKLSIMGGSNGGLLVAACMVQRPDLFGAVLCRVPVIDMLRYHKFTIGKYWIPEYGNAENPEQFPFMYAYSPLHNVKDGEKYPSILIATADSDDRVVPAHAKKFTATLKEKADKSSTVILRLEKKAGHGLGKPTSKLIGEWVDFYAFLEKEGVARTV